MNLRNVLSAYSKLRQLTDDESALLETLRGLNDAERESLVLALQPEKTASKRASKKSNKPASKSARASGMAAAIKSNLDQQRQTKDGACTFVLDNGAVCNTGDSNPIHDKSFGYAGYHEFQPAGKSSAPRAGARSSTNGGATASTQSLETETADVSSVHHAGG